MAQAAIEPLTEDDLPFALALSRAANWNQNEADWRTMLAMGEAFGVRAVQERRLAASALVLPYGDRFGWISMVLVLPEFRRRGLATALLQHAVQRLRGSGRAAVLDATPAGRAVYRLQGFADSWSFERLRREANAPPPAGPAIAGLRELRESDWPAIAAIDALTFGADRVALLRALAWRWPQAARVVERGGGLRGYQFGRDGREAHQIGPVVADDTSVAQALIAHALRQAPGAVYLDLLDARSAALRNWLAQQGFVFQRPFTRMVSGITAAPGDPQCLWVVAGPELG